MKKLIYETMFLFLVGFTLMGCKKEVLTPLPTPESIAKFKAESGDFNNHPFTYLQNKYLDTVLAYELKKDGNEYDSEMFSFQEKLDMITFIDSMKAKKQTTESNDDIQFYQNLETDLMFEINSHPYLQTFINNFASIEGYNEQDMTFNTGSGCDDVISKFAILRYYENDIDIYNLYLDRQNLTGEEEWSLPPTEPIAKAVRYTLHLKWTNKIEYMWNGASQITKSGVLSAMNEWSMATNNKISFVEITKNINWNKTCWFMGWKYFIRISTVNSNKFDGQSTLGRVPWALMDFVNSAGDRTFRHEIGHNLGLYHEHQRPDRDNYITYFPNNTKAGGKSQFTKMTAGSYNYHGSTFDFNSIMLYQSYAFNKNFAIPTITKKDGTTFLAPQTISNTDKSVIKQIYN